MPPAETGLAPSLLIPRKHSDPEPAFAVKKHGLEADAPEACETRPSRPFFGFIEPPLGGEIERAVGGPRNGPEHVPFGAEGDCFAGVPVDDRGA